VKFTCVDVPEAFLQAPIYEVCVWGVAGPVGGGCRRVRRDGAGGFWLSTG
jgi:hypothetical protein